MMICIFLETKYQSTRSNNTNEIMRNLWNRKSYLLGKSTSSSNCSRHSITLQTKAFLRMFYLINSPARNYN